jgi:hypothetical protein
MKRLSTNHSASYVERDDEDAMSVDPSYRCVKCP